MKKTQKISAHENESEDDIFLYSDNNPENEKEETPEKKKSGGQLFSILEGKKRTLSVMKL